MGILSSLVVFIKKNPLILLIILIVLIIVLSAGLFLSSNNKIISFKKNDDLSSIINKVSVLGKDKEVSSKSDYNNALKNLDNAKNESISEKQRYNALAAASENLQSLYSYTNEHALYGLINKDLDDYAKETFPALYDEAYFSYPCQDPACAEQPQPYEIDKIINDLKASNLPDYMKDSYSQDLINNGYRSDTEKYGKVAQYLVIAADIRYATASSTTGVNIKIARDIQAYVKAKYPDVYKIYETADSQLLK